MTTAISHEKLKINDAHPISIHFAEHFHGNYVKRQQAVGNKKHNDGDILISVVFSTLSLFLLIISFSFVRWLCAPHLAHSKYAVPNT